MNKTLRDSIGEKTTYFVQPDPLDTEVLIPSIKIADRLDCAIGYFSSGALRVLAPGLAEFINESDGPFRLIISPQLSPEDYAAIQRGNLIPPEVLEAQLEGLIDEVRISSDLLAKHTLACLSYLVATSRLEIKLATVRGGLFHPKIWIIGSNGETLTVSGSQNFTGAGLANNVEQLRVDRDWMGGSEAEAVRIFSDQYQRWWDGTDTHTQIFDSTPELMTKLVTIAPHYAPTPEDYVGATQGSESQPIDIDPIIGRDVRIAVPDSLDFRSGDFAHQGEAVDSWSACSGRGILEMATGSGKTVTSFVCAAHDQPEIPKAIFIAVPVLPLGRQWEQEASRFGITAINAVDISGRSRRLEAVKGALGRVRSGASHNEVVIVTHDFLCTDDFTQILTQYSVRKMLIADEVHHLGRASFHSIPPQIFDSALGLSATPEREWDADGNDVIRSFFGDVIFRFTLKDAIGRCLVPYDYFIHEVSLTVDEEAKYDDLSEQIRAMGWMTDADSDDVNESASPLQLKLQQRRKVVEQAKSKIDVLEKIFKSTDSRKVHHTLVYTSDKGQDQILEVNAILRKFGIIFHQYTYRETGNRVEAAAILQSFSEGTHQALTAMRILDEGVDIPEVHEAFLLASNTGNRQWIQRRGRVLRKSNSTGKTFAKIHDFVVTRSGAGGITTALQFVDNSEFARVVEFASAARNATNIDGPLQWVTKNLTD